MQYRKDKTGRDLSVLGYGCMRFTQTMGRIDLKKAEQEVLCAIDKGINYFDTAYIYPGSEAALGEILHRNNLRDRVYIATKLPHYLIKSTKSPDKFFDEQLRRLQTDHVDYYLMHMLTDVKTWERLKALGIEEWLEAKKKSGAIGQIGFSYHGNSDMFCKLIDAYDWDFCQIQYNYLDEHSQAGRTGLTYAAGKGIPVIIMEPLRGGKLVNDLPKAALQAFAEGDPTRSPAGWALRWLWDQPEVTCLLSGMNSIEMVEENCRLADASPVGCVTEKERAVYAAAVEALAGAVKIPCTGCRYCMPCPKGVDIPGVFAAYNRRHAEGWFAGIRDYVMCTAVRRDSTAASNCIACGKCMRHCPQGIAIPDELKKVKKKMEGPAYRVGKRVLRLIMKY